MAKTAKFTIICGGKTIYNLDDLKENFYVDNILDYFKAHTLHRWLKSKGFNEEYEKVNEISGDNYSDKEIIRQLMYIFDIEESPEIESDLRKIEYIKNHDRLDSRYEQAIKIDETMFQKYQTKYQEGYTSLINHMLEYPQNRIILKKDISRIVTEYYWIFTHDFCRLFYMFYQRAPYAAFLLLANKTTRGFYIPSDDCSFFYKKNEKKQMYQYICGRCDKVEKKEELVECLPQIINVLYFDKNKKTFYKRKSENNYSSYIYNDKYNEKWQKIEPNGKKYMILGMGYGLQIKSIGDSKIYEANEIENKFLILDGIECSYTWSVSSLATIYYMEV